MTEKGQWDVLYISGNINHRNWRITHSIQELLQLHFPQINARIIFSNKNTIGSMFPTKDRLPMNLCSNIIYRFQCKASDECTSSYIGSTTRRLKERICEHMGVSFLTGNNLSDPRSSIYDHCLDTGHRITEDSFEILGGCREDDNILLLESVYIKYYRPDLNNMESAYPLQLTWVCNSPSLQLTWFLFSLPHFWSFSLPRTFECNTLLTDRYIWIWQPALAPCFPWLVLLFLIFQVLYWHLCSSIYS